MNKDQLEKIVRKRLEYSKEGILYSIEKAREGNPFAGEPDPARLKERLQVKTNVTPQIADAVQAQVRESKEKLKERKESTQAEDAVPSSEPPDLLTRPSRKPGGPEKIWGDTIDFVSVAFLEKGANQARSVGRVIYQGGFAQGTGVLVAPGVFLTNQHVIENINQAKSMLVEFDFEEDLNGVQKQVSQFRFDTSLFISDPVEGLDFTLIGVGPRVQGPNELESFGLSPLSDASNKHMIGEFANIVQHPSGRYKEVVLRENRLVNRFDDCLHYVADTEPGSSGSPVYNSEWQLIALHHWGGPWIDQVNSPTLKDLEINEGIRISSIVRKLRSRLPYLSASQRKRVQEVLKMSEASLISVPTSSELKRTSSNEAVVSPDGRVTWTLPVELSVMIPALSQESKEIEEAATEGIRLGETQPSQENGGYESRRGYLPDLLTGFHVPLPRLDSSIQQDAARLLDPLPGDHPNELKYHHFSVVINKRRKLAFFTACSIDGTTAKSINRRTRAVSDLTSDSSGLQESVENLSNAESDSWSHDRRIAREDYSGPEIYSGQQVPGYPNPYDPDRHKRMFQKGHLVRRLDPAWGDEDDALAAELDTFHWTNAAPQVGFFNQGKADDLPGTGNGKLWRAAENYVLRNAVAEDMRVQSFTGPIFRDDDRPYRNIQIPAKFFKVTVWVEHGKLRSLALIVDQEQVFREWPESIGTPEFFESFGAREAFQDPDELDRVSDFLSTIVEVEDLTHLDFGAEVREADIRYGEGSERLESYDQIPWTDDDTDHGEKPSNLIGASVSDPDDLTKISGVGPKLILRLNKLGVFYFHQIASWTEEEAAYIDYQIGGRGRIFREKWIDQASELKKS